MPDDPQTALDMAVMDRLVHVLEGQQARAVEAAERQGKRDVELAEILSGIRDAMRMSNDNNAHTTKAVEELTTTVSAFMKLIERDLDDRHDRATWLRGLVDKQVVVKFLGLLATGVAFLGMLYAGGDHFVSRIEAANAAAAVIAGDN